MPLLETPSRVWRRIQDAQHVDMPSLPSLPAIDDITEDLDSSLLPNNNSKRTQHDDLELSLPVQPTPPLPSTRHSQQQQAPPSRRSSAGQTSSILSQGLNKSTRSTATVRFADKHESFEISAAGTTTTSDFSGFHPDGGDADADDINSKFINGLALPDIDLSLGLDDALQPVSRPHSPLRRDSSSVGLRSDSRDPTPVVSRTASRTSSPRIPPEDTLSVRSDSKDPSFVLSRTASHAPSSHPSTSTNARQKPSYSSSIRSDRSEAKSATGTPSSTRRPTLLRPRTPSLTRSGTGSQASTTPNTTPPSDISVSHLEASRVSRSSLHPSQSQSHSRRSSLARSPALTHSFGHERPGQVQNHSSPVTADSPTAFTPSDDDGNGEGEGEEDVLHEANSQEPRSTTPPPPHDEQGLEPTQESIVTADQTPCPPPRQIYTPSSSLSLRHSRAARQVQFSSPIYHSHDSESYVRPPTRDPEEQELVEESGEEREDEEGLELEGDREKTPIAARKEFFLSVVNSTVRLGTRPRLSGAWGNTTTTSMIAPTPRPTHTIRATTANMTLNRNRSRNSLNPLTTPASSSTPHSRRLAGDISTASSNHDLTVHPRANASFDPTMGPKGAAGRFNATKLNTYLHALNRRLVEENEELTAQLNALRAQQGGNISDLMNNTTAMEREAEVEELKGNLVTLEQERERDRERWKERMHEVQEGVVGLVKELEDRATDAERRAMAASQRAKQTAEAEAAGQELQADRALREELHRAEEEGAWLREENVNMKTRLATVDATKVSLQKHAGQLEEQLQKAQAQIEELNSALASSEANAEGFAEELAGAQVELDGALEDVDVLKQRVTELEERAEAAEEAAVGLTRALEDAEAQIVQHEEEVSALQVRTRELERRNASFSQSRDQSQSQSRGGGGLTTITEERSTFVDRPESISQASQAQAHIQELEVLERELDTAHREIARLNHLLSNSPTRTALQQAKDMRIAMLEREKVELEERVRTLKVMLGGSAAAGTPALPGGISPAVNRTLAVLKTPKTPGGPLREMSWLNQTTFANAGGAEASPYVRQIAVLERELAHANESVDDKIDKLEEVGHGVVVLNTKLGDALTRVGVLENEVARLERKEERRTKRMKRVKCLKCGGGLDLSAVFRIGDEDQSSMVDATTSLAVTSDPSTPSAKSSDVLRFALKTVNEQLDFLKSQWESDKDRLLGERDVLREVAKRAEEDKARRARDEKKRVGVDAELDKAKEMVAELEAELQAERAKLRAITVERNRELHDKKDIAAELQRAQADMDLVKEQLRKHKQENYELESELRSNAIAENKARYLRTKLDDNLELIEQLRRERDVLAENHSDLQRQFARAAERVEKLRQRVQASQTGHDERRHQLDMQVQEIEDLKQALTQRSSDLERIEQEKKRMSKEHSDVMRTVSSLENDLKRVKKDAETFGRDLRALKAERDELALKRREENGRAERVQDQLRTHIGVLESHLEVEMSRRVALQDQMQAHICGGEEGDVARLRLEHNKECKGLLLQIRYLKDKFTRESTFRIELAYQKNYLLTIISHLEKNEQKVLAVIARTGYPAQLETPSIAPGRRRRSLKSVATLAVFLARVRRSARTWSEQRAAKPLVAAALEDVRRRRVAGRGPAP